MINQIKLNFYSTTFLILIFCLNIHVLSQTQNLNEKLDTLFSSPYFQKTQIALDIYNLTDDSQIFSKNAKQLFRPASVEKILTTSSAMIFLDDDFKFKTSVFHSGEIEDSICKGDLYVVGGLDPDFMHKDLDSLVTEIKKFGIKKITGNLYADVSNIDSLFWGEGWMWDDDPGSYAAYLSALNINDNSIQVVVEPDSVNGPAKVKLIPENNFIHINNFSQTINSGKSNLTVTRDWIHRSNTIIVNGNILLSQKPDTITVNIFDPKFYFLNLMKESLFKAGIKFSGKIVTLSLSNDVSEIFTLERELDSVIVNTNKISDNLSAEMILRSIALANFTKPASASKGIVFVDSLITLAGFNPKDYRIADGSGLSYYNLISAELVTGILKYLYYNEENVFVKLYNSLPISGYDGTLKNRFKNSSASKRVRAKTGTISGASNLAGFINSKQGKLIAFTIFIQNFTGPASEARKIQDKICELLFEEL